MQLAEALFWRTKAGEAAAKRLSAWANWAMGEGTMDPTGTGNGFRGNPGDMPAGWHLAMDVEITMREWHHANGRLGKYIIHVYGKGERACTVEDAMLSRLMGTLYRNPVALENAIGGVVEKALLDFGEFLAERRGL